METLTTKTTIELKDVPLRDCVIISRKIPMGAISSFFQEAYGTLYGYAMRGAVASDCFGRYNSWDPTACEVEAGVVVDHPLPAAGEIQPSTLGGHRALTTRHIGPFSKVEAAYKAIQQHAEEEHLTLAGAPYEMYRDDPQTVPEAELRTDVYWPVA